MKNICECDWRELYKTHSISKQYLRDLITNKMPPTEERRLDCIKSWKLFGYIQSHIGIHENPRENSAKLPPIFMKEYVSRDDLARLWKRTLRKKEFWLNLGECY